MIDRPNQAEFAPFYAGYVSLVPEANIVQVPMERARTVSPPLAHWGEALLGGMVFSIDKALRDLDWAPRFGLADGYRDSYEWFAREGRDRYEYDFSRDDALLAELGYG